MIERLVSPESLIRYLCSAGGAAAGDGLGEAWTMILSESACQLVFVTCAAAPENERAAMSDAAVSTPVSRNKIKCYPPGRERLQVPLPFRIRLPRPASLSKG